MIFNIFLILFILFFIIFISWRYLSLRYTIPMPSFLKLFIEIENPIFTNNHAKNIISKLPLKNDITIIDFGCGAGRVTIPLGKSLQPYNGTVIGYDIQDKMLEIVKKKIISSSLNNILLLNTLNEYKNKIDIVLLVNVLGEIPSKEKTISDIYNLLKDDGMISVTEVIADPHFIRQKELIQLFQNANFKIESIFGSKLAYTIHFVKN